MASEKCSWEIYPRGVDDDEDSELNPRICGRKAIIVFEVDNPKANRPNEPAVLTYPRCQMHYTPAAQLRAAKEGYRTVELEDA